MGKTRHRAMTQKHRNDLKQQFPSDIAPLKCQAAVMWFMYNILNNYNNFLRNFIVDIVLWYLITSNRPRPGCSK